MKIIADRGRCCGTAMCLSAAPRHFALDPADRRVLVLIEGPAEEDRDEVEEAVEMCPTSALRIE